MIVTQLGWVTPVSTCQLLEANLEWKTEFECVGHELFTIHKYEMLPHTSDNHFAFGYGSGMFNPQDRSSENTLWCSYSRCAREPGTFREECIRTAKLVAIEAERLGRPIFVMLSGGLDSEVVAKAFVEASVSFECITYRFKGGLNSHETRFVDAFVRRHKLKHRYYDIDILPWLESDEAVQILNESQAASCVLLPHMKLMSHIWYDLKSLPVLGNGDVYLENEKGWNYYELEYMLTWFRHALKHNMLGAIGFFQYTPEITLSMLREPKIERLGRNSDAYANKAYDTSRFVKYNIYKKHWPDLVTRPKFSGHELVKDEFAERSKELVIDTERWIDKWLLSYDDFRSMLEPNEEAYRLSAELPPRETAGQWILGS